MSNVKYFSAILCNCCKYHPNSRVPLEAFCGTQSKTIQWMLGFTETDSLLQRDLFLHVTQRKDSTRKFICQFSWKCHYSNLFHCVLLLLELHNPQEFMAFICKDLAWGHISRDKEYFLWFLNHHTMSGLSTVTKYIIYIIAYV